MKQPEIPTYDAQFDSECDLCGMDILVGEQFSWYQQEAVHPQCAAEELREGEE